MNDATGCFQVLGLPPYADLVMVRRAYARRLRELDPDVDAAGFEQLRLAYEAARAWCDQHADITEADIQPTALPAGTSDAGAPKDDFAEGLVRQLAEDAATQPAAAMDALLAGALATLRMRYVDAPGELEDRLVDRLQDGSIANRPALFDAADIHFHWTEIGRGQRDEPRRQWVERVLAQRETWAGFEERQRRRWMALIERATQGIDQALARAWPEMARLHAAVPDWLALHLPAGTLAAWVAAFDTPPVPAPRQGSRWQRRAWLSRGAWGIPLVACFAAAAVIYGLPGLGSLSMQGVGTQADSPTTCMALHARLDGAAPFRGLPDDEIAQLKRRAHRCAAAGHWSHPAALGH